MARRSPGGPSISSCGRRRCSCRASMPTTCPRACTRTAPSCTACRRPRSRRCARRRAQPASGAAADQVAGRDARRTAGRTCWASKPCIADFAAYHVVWFYRGRHIDCRAELDPYPKLLAWRDRMAAIGHGTAHRDRPGRGARRRAPRLARDAAPLRSAGRRSQARRARPRAAVRQCARLDRGRGAVHRRRRDRPAAHATPRSARSPCISRGWATTGAAQR